MLERYTRALRWALLNRYFTASLAVGLLLLSMALMMTRVPFQLFGEPEIGQFFVNVEAPNTYGIDDSAELAHVRRAIMASGILCAGENEGDCDGDVRQR